MSFLAIDIGGTYIKSARVFGQDCTLSSVFRTPIPAFKSADLGHCEISMGDLRESLDTHFAKQSSAGPIQGLLLTHQMHGFVLADPSGRAVSDYYSWQDQRSQQEFARIKSQLDPEIFKNHGREIKPGYPIVILSHLHRQGLNLKNLTPLSLGEWLASELCQKKILSIDKSNASAFGLYDFTKKNINQELIQFLDLRDIQWPELQEDLHCVGLGHSKYFSQAFPIYLSHGDQQMALAGSLFRETNTVCLNIATGSQCNRISDKLDFGNYQIRPYLNDFYLKTQTHIPAGRAINRLFHFFSQVVKAPDSDLFFERLDSKTCLMTDSPLKVKLGFFDGAYETEGSILGLHDLTMTPENLFYACLENIALNHLDGTVKIDPAKTWTQVLMAGGLGQKSKTLQQIVKKHFQSELIFPLFPEDTLIGLMIKAHLIETKQTDWFGVMNLLAQKKGPLSL